MQNDPLVLIALAAGLVVALIVALFVWKRQSARRSAHLREHFGPEYERALSQHRSRAEAEKELWHRYKRVEKLNIHPLSAEQCARFGSSWGELQQRFVDDPRVAVGEADQLVKQVMNARGYPVGDYAQRVADLSVEHANVLNHYRAARAIVKASERGEASTEDLRQAMVHYRALFTDLLAMQSQVGARLSTAPA